MADDADCASFLLEQIKRPEMLPREELLLYGWLQAFVHHRQHVSMAEESLILPASNYFIDRNDTARLLPSYLLKAAYLHDQGYHNEEQAVLDDGCTRAILLGDSVRAGDFMAEKGECYVYAYKDYRHAANAYRRALELRETADNQFSLGIALGLSHDDSATWHTNRSVVLALQCGDTLRAVRYLRNHAHLMAYVSPDYRKAIDLFHRTMSLSDDVETLEIPASA